MATTITLEGAARTEFGKGAARRMRVANLIPATVYAGGEEPGAQGSRRCRQPAGEDRGQR